MSFLRRLPTRQLIGLCAAVAILAAGGVVVGSAIAGGGPAPPPRALPVAVRDALGGGSVPGVSARISFTNRLVNLSGMEGTRTTPLLTGASGRLWAAPGRRLRLELQSDGGDVEVVSNGRTFTVYEPSSHTAYRGALPPAHARSKRAGSADALPTLAEIRRALGQVAQHAFVGRAQPGTLAGRPDYTVRLSPRPRAGLLGAAELAWDAANGTPLRLAVYARGDSSPVLELKATDVSYEPIAQSVFAIAPPAGTKIVNVQTPRGARESRARPRRSRAPSTLPTVRRAVPFALSAPTRLQGRALRGVHLVGRGTKAGALLTYGDNLGGFAVLERRTDAHAGATRNTTARLGRVDVNGVSGQELATPLGTLVRFSRGGVDYTVVGLVPPAVAAGAARGL
jgi:outer membrane lipoprotein-sorting protein